MAHKNALERQDKVKSLMIDGMLARGQMKQLAKEFGCSDAAIRADIVYWRHRELGTKETYHVGKHKRAKIRKRDNGICHYCGGAGDIVEHKIPAAQGGTSSDDNLVLACQSCNVKKMLKDGTKLVY